jgi:hypothetical protein
MSLNIKDFLGQYVKPNALKLGGENAIEDITTGGGGSQDLGQVLDEGNTTGGNDILISDGDAIILDNFSRLQEGTIDAGLGGNGGIAQICGLGYELKWEGGVLYVMNSSGNQIRQSLYNFTNTPIADDDDTKGYVIGSIWSLDDLTNYVCSDNSTGAAVWDLVTAPVGPTGPAGPTGPSGTSEINYSKVSISSASMSTLFNDGITLISNDYLDERWLTILSIGARMIGCDTSYATASKLLVQHGLGSQTLFENSKVFDGGNISYNLFTPIFEATYANDPFDIILTSDALPEDGDGTIEVYLFWSAILK